MRRNGKEHALKIMSDGIRTDIRASLTVTNQVIGTCLVRDCRPPAGVEIIDRVYIVPTYLMTLKWKDKNGLPQVCYFEVVRYGIVGGNYDAAYKDGREATPIVTFTEFTTQNPWCQSGIGYVIEGQKTLHDGPDDPLKIWPYRKQDNKWWFAFCSLGCPEVVGPGEWDRLNKYILEATRVPSPGYVAGKPPPGEPGEAWSYMDIAYQAIPEKELPQTIYYVEDWAEWNAAKKDWDIKYSTKSIAEGLDNSLTKHLEDINVTKVSSQTEAKLYSCEFRQAFDPNRGSFAAALVTALSYPIDPVAIDLNGDGITTISSTKGGLWFDHDANGFAEATGWVGADDGLLVMDRNGNGIIDDGRDLLGDSAILSNGEIASDGFEALATYDSNLDGKIDAADPIFAQLQVWQDVDSDGYSFYAKGVTH